MGDHQVFKLKCVNCGEPVLCDESVLKRPCECGDCGQPIIIGLYPSLVQAKEKLDARKKAEREEKLRLLHEAKMVALERRAAAAEERRLKKEQAKQKKREEQNNALVPLVTESDKPEPAYNTEAVQTDAPQQVLISPGRHYYFPEFAGSREPPSVLQVIVEQKPVRKWRPGVAGMLSVIVPGLGQLYKGQPVNGFAWFILTVISYALFVIPGVIVHFCCVIGALSGDPYRD